jgi:hypothetical protein
LASGQGKLGLPALGGLFDNIIPDLEVARLSNRALMEGIYRLAWLKDAANLVPVNWRDMETEELGSVYESLLELTPLLIDEGRGFGFAKGDESKGNQRKTTGSYYTPDSLVQTLLDSALDPVLDRIESESRDKVEGLLGVTVIDPACGSGHFLLSGARRIAARVARARMGGVASAADYRHALRDAVRSCIYGVDRNPMAVELTKVALWIETVEPGKPLGFLDANILCGDSLLGIFDLEVLRASIPDAAYKPLSGDDKNAAKYFERRNKAEREGQGTFDFSGARSTLPAAPPLAALLQAVRLLPEDSTAEISEKKQRLEAARAERERENWRLAADLYIAAFLLPKRDAPHDPGVAVVPTTDHVWRQLGPGQLYRPLIAATLELRAHARLFHWPLEFPDVLAKGGFDVVIGNPPWERVKLQEREFFASREPEIAEAPTAYARSQMIQRLKTAEPGTRERKLYDEFEATRRVAEASSVFARESGRFPLTARGDINTYALFAELFTMLGRGAGIITPTGIATEGTTAAFFADLVDRHRLVSLTDFENRDGLFPAVDSRMKFSILTIGRGGTSEFAFFLTHPSQLSDSRRRFTLDSAAIHRTNPNTKTAPIFRSRFDAELTTKIHARVPVLVDDSNSHAGDPWSFVYLTKMFDMTDNSDEFHSPEQLKALGSTMVGNCRAAKDGAFVPVFEAKMIHLFDHRWSTYEGGDFRDSSPVEKANPAFEVSPRYWLQAKRVVERLDSKHWRKSWLLGWRDICRATDERTVIAAIYPAVAIGNTLHSMFLGQDALLTSAFLTCISSIIVDYVARQKLGGTHLTVEILKQLPVLSPAKYSKDDLQYVSSRALQLVFTSHSMTPFARDLGYDGPPFPWNENRRAELRAELDAWYAQAYRLTRDELRYILDPADVMGEDYPSETFRVLKNNEMKKYGEYRTRRLILEAWDRLEAGDLK